MSIIFSAGIIGKKGVRRLEDYNNAEQKEKFNLDEGYPNGIILYLALHGVTHFPNKLMRDHKH